jgi:prolyl-tRNA synthetase
VISERGLKEGRVELQARREAQASTVPLTEVAAQVKGRLTA